MTDREIGSLLPTRPGELKSLLDLADHRRTSGLTSITGVPPCGMLDVLRRLTETFRHHRVRHALCGTLALAFFARPRATDLLAFVCCAEQHETIVQALGQAGFAPREVEPPQLTFVDAFSGIAVVMRLGTADPERAAAAGPLAADCLGVATRLIRPEYLLWIYCHNAMLQDRADAVALLKGGQVDLSWLRAQFLAANDKRADTQLSILQLCAKHDADQGDYSASVARRLAARKNIPLPLPVYRLPLSDSSPQT